MLEMGEAEFQSNEAHLSLNKFIRGKVNHKPEPSLHAGVFFSQEKKKKRRCWSWRCRFALRHLLQSPSVRHCNPELELGARFGDVSCGFAVNSEALGGWCGVDSP